jgi:phosphatidylglycerophosphate synthase
MITPDSPVSLKLQQVAHATHDVITPANVVDGAAFGLALHAVPRLDQWQGIAEATIAYGADWVDGDLARATGTSSDLGATVDSVGDKIKVLLAGIKMWRDDLADRDALLAVGAQNMATTALTAYDRYRNEQPTITKARRLGQAAMFGQATGLGLQTIGTRVQRDGRETAGRTIRKTGRFLTIATASTLGVASVIDYTKTVLTGTKKQRPNKRHPLEQTQELPDGGWEVVKQPRSEGTGISTNTTRRGIVGSY